MLGGMMRGLAGFALLSCVAAGAAGAAAPEFPELRRPPATMPADAPAPRAVDPGGDVGSWERRRAEIRGAWERLLGPMPDRVPPAVEVLSREELADHTRLLLRYRNDAASTNDAYLLVPKGARGRLPGVVCLHPTSKTHIGDPVGLSNRESVHHALHLVRRGYVCLAPRNYLWAVDGRGWKASADAVKRRGPYTTGMAKMLFDATRAVDVLADRPEVDAARIGAIGHSLGGKEALYLAAFDGRVVASVSCEGGVGLGMSNWDADHYFGDAVRRPGFARDHEEVLALVAPRAILVIGGESADGKRSWPYVEAALPVWRLYGAESRVGLLRHTDGHHFPAPGPDRERTYRWLDRWLKPQ
jgi:hypothetical protein